MIVHGTAYYANLDKKNEMSGKYQMNICNLSAADVKALKAAGIDIKTPKPGNPKQATWGHYIVGKSANPVKAYDTHKQELGFGVKIGNGSKVRVQINPYPYDYKGKKGIGCGLNAVMVTELVEYAGGTDELFNLDNAADDLGF